MFETEPAKELSDSKSKAGVIASSNSNSPSETPQREVDEDTWGLVWDAGSREFHFRNRLTDEKQPVPAPQNETSPPKPINQENQEETSSKPISQDKQEETSSNPVPRNLPLRNKNSLSSKQPSK
jgi:hypothetical protein